MPTLLYTVSPDMEGDIQTNRIKQLDDEDALEIPDEDNEENKEQRPQWCLVGRLWTSKAFKSMALLETMRKVWNPIHEMTLGELGANLFYFQFHSRRNMERVQRLAPWHITNTF